MSRVHLTQTLNVLPMQELSLLHGEPPYKDVLINILGCVEEFCFETYVITVNYTLKKNEQKLKSDTNGNSFFSL